MSHDLILTLAHGAYTASLAMLAYWYGLREGRREQALGSKKGPPPKRRP